MNRAKLLVLPVTAGLVVSLLAGCGGGPGGGDGGSDSPIVVGSTDERITTLDPAGAYDIGTWTLFTNAFQTLLRYPPDGSAPKPEAAKRCSFTDEESTAYRCTIRKGLKFANGHDLTAEDVAFSIKRNVRIKNVNGPSSLFINIDRVEAPDESTVVFHLKKPDATLPFILATPAAAIVDSEVYPANKLIGEDKIAGSGVYALEEFERPSGDDERVLTAKFVANKNYKGGLTRKNSAVTVRYFQDSEKMQSALEKGDIDLTHRTLTPHQILDLQERNTEDIKVIEAPGTEIRYLAFNVSDDVVKDVAVRRAMAQLIDRKVLVRNVYQRTAEPLNSLIPKGISGHNNAFYNAYGEPSRAKARAILDKAGVSTPISLTLWYTSDHYGTVTKGEFEELKRQLENSGMFKIALKSRKWPQYQEGWAKHEYQVFGLGWFPDFPDPDNYISPFMIKENYLKSAYFNPTIANEILPRSRQQADRGAVVQEFDEAQEIIAEDVPMLPLWQGKQYVAAREEINGVEWTLDSSQTFRFWEFARGARG